LLLLSLSLSLCLIFVVCCSENGGERYYEVGRCIFEINSMPLL
jgi:hypothetical protein